MHLETNQEKRVSEYIRKYPKVAASSFEDVRPWAVSVRNSWGMNLNNPIYQKAWKMHPMHNEIVRREIDRMIAAGICWTLIIYMLFRRFRDILGERAGSCYTFGEYFCLLQNHGLRLRIKKCFFVPPNVELLAIQSKTEFCMSMIERLTRLREISLWLRKKYFALY